MSFAWKAAGITYNHYLAVAARVVRRSLKEEARIVADRRAPITELKVARWTNGRQGDVKPVSDVVMKSAEGAA